MKFEKPSLSPGRINEAGYITGTYRVPCNRLTLNFQGYLSVLINVLGRGASRLLLPHMCSSIRPVPIIHITRSRHHALPTSNYRCMGSRRLRVECQGLIF